MGGLGRGEEGEWKFAGRDSVKRVQPVYIKRCVSKCRANERTLVRKLTFVCPDRRSSVTWEISARGFCTKTIRLTLYSWILQSMKRVKQFGYHLHTETSNRVSYYGFRWQLVWCRRLTIPCATSTICSFRPSAFLELFTSQGITHRLMIS